MAERSIGRDHGVVAEIRIAARTGRRVLPTAALRIIENHVDLFVGRRRALRAVESEAIVGRLSRSAVGGIHRQLPRPENEGMIVIDRIIGAEESPIMLPRKLRFMARGVVFHFQSGDAARANMEDVLRDANEKLEVLKCAQRQWRTAGIIFDEAILGQAIGGFGVLAERSIGRDRGVVAEIRIAARTGRRVLPTAALCIFKDQIDLGLVG